MGARFPRLAKVTVRFGTPIGLEAYQDCPPAGPPALTDDVMDAIAALTGQERANAYNDVPSGVNDD